MTIDYDEWTRTENAIGKESIRKCFEELSSGREVRLTSLCPEFEIKTEDTYTTWAPPSSPEAKANNPATNLGNLVTLYNKILLPIHPHSTKQDFALMNTTSLEDLILLLKGNPNNYIPILMSDPNDYRVAGIYDDLFETCQDLYGHYPVNVGSRSATFQTLSFIAAKGAIKGGTIRLEEQMKRFPNIDHNWVLLNEVNEIASRDVEGLRLMSEFQAMDPLMTKRSLATAITDLRVYGHEDLVKFVLDNFSGNLFALGRILICYDAHLVQPSSHGLGGFKNYTTGHLETMAFLRVLPLISKDVKELDKKNLRLLFNSPGARSTVSLQNYKMQVFLKGGDDVNTLNELAKFGERHKKELKRMSEYREFVAQGKLGEATEVLRKSSEVYGQISEEVRELAKKEKTAKLATYSMTGGATILSDVALVLWQGLPLEWKLVIMLFKDMLGFSGAKELDAKRIVEWVYDIQQWPWYEKGIPYLYWRASEPHSS
jgi:hypothetical protein